ncbi:MAG TPA: Rossmann fold nucleotide-binding protein [Nocardioides sp.]|nr:Rossmann fold nucleotide-binding protein [Nocardioides sp.]
MKRSRGRVVHVETLEAFDDRLAAGATSLRGWRIRSVDLTRRHDALTAIDVGGATFLGCRFARGDEERLADRGALVLSVPDDVPVDPRSELYTPQELYDAPRYADSLDGRAYAWSQRPADPQDALARALHDHTVDLALESWVAGKRMVGVMGGHRLERGHPGYADAARLAAALGRDLVVATGGGPGAMEAANLGPHFSDHPDGLDEALAMLAEAPTYRPSVEAWVGRAFAVLERFPSTARTLGIPTWHYGHEPPNAFATAIAKYFRNSTREAILLRICEAGIVFLPGAGGTVQEVFQDACENYYADESGVAPMVLVGATYWTEQLPAWPLLQHLSRGKPMEGHVHLVDSPEDAVNLLVSGT